MHDLVRGLETARPCEKSSSPWVISSVIQKNCALGTSNKVVCDSALCISNKYEHSVCLIYRCVCGCVVEGPRIETAVLLPELP